MKAFILNTHKHQNPNTSNDASTKLLKEFINFNKTVERRLYLKSNSTNTPEYENHQYAHEYNDPLRQQRRFVEGDDFEGKDSETAKTAEETEESRAKKLIKLLNITFKQDFF